MKIEFVTVSAESRVFATEVVCLTHILGEEGKKGGEKTGISSLPGQNRSPFEEGRSLEGW